MKRAPVTEDDVKGLVKDWFDFKGAWHYAPTQNGMGVVGIHDRIGCVPLLITQEMVGCTIGAFASVEAKRPGRRREVNRGMSAAQALHMQAIRDAYGFTVVCDGKEDLERLDTLMTPTWIRLGNTVAAQSMREEG